MHKKRRLIWHFYPSYLIIILISIIAVTWYASIEARQFFLEKNEADLKARAKLFEGQIITFLDPLNREKIDLLCKEAGEMSSTRITVILPTGEVVGDSDSDPMMMDNHADRIEFMEASVGDSGMSIRTSRTLGKDFMYVGIPVNKGDTFLAVVRTSISVDVIDTAIKGIQTRIMLGALIMVFLGAIVSLIVSRRISRPIERLKQGAGYFIKGDLNYRLPVSDIPRQICSDVILQSSRAASYRKWSGTVIYSNLSQRPYPAKGLSRRKSLFLRVRNDIFLGMGH